MLGYYEVTGKPHCDPDRAPSYGLRSDAERWAVVTDVRAIGYLSIDHVPALELIGVAASP